MTDLTQKHCTVCEGGVKPLSSTQASDLLKKLNENWQLDKQATILSRRFTFKGFYRTMAFVNAIAWIANQEGHHPDLHVGYNYCEINYTTHAINGLSENDFICAAKIDQLM